MHRQNVTPPLIVLEYSQRSMTSTSRVCAASLARFTPLRLRSVKDVPRRSAARRKQISSIEASFDETSDDDLLCRWLKIHRT